MGRSSKEEERLPRKCLGISFSDKKGTESSPFPNLKQFAGRSIIHFFQSR